MWKYKEAKRQCATMWEICIPTCSSAGELISGVPGACETFSSHARSECMANMASASVGGRTVVKLLPESQGRDRSARVLELQSAEGIRYQYIAVALHCDHVLGPQQARGLCKGSVRGRTGPARRSEPVLVSFINDPSARDQRARRANRVECREGLPRHGKHAVPECADSA